MLMVPSMRGFVGAAAPIQFSFVDPAPVPSSQYAVVSSPVLNVPLGGAVATISSSNGISPYYVSLDGVNWLSSVTVPVGGTIYALGYAPSVNAFGAYTYTVTIGTVSRDFHVSTSQSGGG
jgi:hypothetical protein